MSEKRDDYSKCNLLETSVTAAISAKLNLNYIDKEIDENENFDGAKEQIENSNKTAEKTKFENNTAEKPTEYVYVAEDDTAGP